MLAIVIFILILSFLVMLHEFGHFLMAKRAGIGVEEFGFGLPPRAWGKKINGTIYSINWLPFGGFVRLVGEDPTDKNRDAKNSYFRKSLKDRALVVVAGVVSNFILAVVIFYIAIIALGFKVNLPLIVDHQFKFVNQTKQVLIGNLDKTTSEATGIKPGDSILKVGDTFVGGIADFEAILKERRGQNLTLTLENPTNNAQRIANTYIYERVLISSIEADSPADKSGIKSGSYVLSVDGAQVYTIPDLQNLVRASEGRNLKIDLEEPNGNIKTVEPSPVFSPTLNVPALGVSLSEVFFPGADRNEDLMGSKMEAGELVVLNYKTLPQKLFSGFAHSYNTVDYSVRVFADLISYAVKSHDITPVSEGVSGPVGIEQITKQAVSLGPVSVLQLIGLLSLNLAIVNILPFPALDGGRFFFLIVEAVTRKRVHPTFEKWVHQIGFAVLLALIVLVTYNDILKLVTK